MPFSGLPGFISLLEKKGELIRIKAFANPVLEISEIADRVVKNNGKALLFENTGTEFPLLINAFGSDARLKLALGERYPGEITEDIKNLFLTLTSGTGSPLKSLLSLARLSGYMPSKISGKGICQHVVNRDPDLSVLPVLKCWPYDGGRFITLPMVHTIHPESGKTNVGMYRMQILDAKSTGMHWQLHKTGANHFEAWKAAGSKMPVSVALGGDPVYTYAATAPLPENIDEYILAGFLRKKKVKLVRCITNDLYVPADADIIIEGFVDPAEELVWEGPFGDHTGFYSLADWYPRFHVTCITHSRNAVYPATIVGVPPHEDAWLIKATEKIFLAPLKLALLPEIEDMHMPSPGAAHNLVIVKINKKYQGQGKKVISSLLGTGQMMFTKCLIVVSGNVDIRDYGQLFSHVLENTSFRHDLIFTSGPLDILDHSSGTFAMGGKLGIDGTVKHEQELLRETETETVHPNYRQYKIARVNQSEFAGAAEKSRREFMNSGIQESYRLIIAVDHSVDITDLYQVAWQVLGNTDPQRDIDIISDASIYIDGTIKAGNGRKFRRKWPNVVCSDDDTIKRIDHLWDTLGCGDFIESPSLKIKKLLREGRDEIIVRDI